MCLRGCGHHACHCTVMGLSSQPHRAEQDAPLFKTANNRCRFDFCGVTLQTTTGLRIGTLVRVVIQPVRLAAVKCRGWSVTRAAVTCKCRDPCLCPVCNLCQSFIIMTNAAVKLMEPQT